MRLETHSVHRSEFMDTGQIHRRFGPDGIRDFVPAYELIGTITDDTH